MLHRQFIVLLSAVPNFTKKFLKNKPAFKQAESLDLSLTAVNQWLFQCQKMNFFSVYKFLPGLFLFYIYIIFFLINNSQILFTVFKTCFFEIYGKIRMECKINKKLIIIYLFVCINNKLLSINNSKSCTKFFKNLLNFT